MKSQSEIASDLRKATERLNKIGTETTKSLELIEELKKAVANQDNASQELIDAADALSTQLAAVDDMVPDPVDNPTETPTA